MRVQFTTGLDDLVDVNLRFLGGSQWGVEQRRKARRWATLAFAAGMSLIGLRAAPAAAPAVIAGFFVFVLVLAVGFSFVYGWLYDTMLRRRIRSFLRTHLGPEQEWVCEIELREDGTWSRGQGVELTFPWNELTAVEDLSDGVLLRFRPGVIFARNRAFATPDERQRFLDRARAAPTAALADRGRV